MGVVDGAVRDPYSGVCGSKALMLWRGRVEIGKRL